VKKLDKKRESGQPRHAHSLLGNAVSGGGNGIELFGAFCKAPKNLVWWQKPQTIQLTFQSTNTCTILASILYHPIFYAIGKCG